MQIEYEDFKKLFFSDYIDYKSSYDIIMIKLERMIDLDNLINQIYTIYKNKYLIFMDFEIEDELLEKIKNYLEENNIKYTITSIPYIEGLNKLEYLEILEGKYD